MTTWFTACQWVSLTVMALGSVVRWSEWQEAGSRSMFRTSHVAVKRNLLIQSYRAKPKTEAPEREGRMHISSYVPHKTSLIFNVLIFHWNIYKTIRTTPCVVSCNFRILWNVFALDVHIAFTIIVDEMKFYWGISHCNIIPQRDSSILVCYKQ